jgi:hypothetical protein
LQGLVHARKGYHRNRPALRWRKELEHCGGDDAERTFSTDEQLLQIVAGIVLAERTQSVKDAPIRQHDFQPEHEVAHGPVAQHCGSAGIGGNVTTDLAASFGAEAQREQTPGFFGRFLHFGQDTACFDGNRVRERWRHRTCRCCHLAA